MTQAIRFHELDSDATFAAAAERSMQEPVVLYKHSATCGTSYRARREIQRLTEPGDPPVYEVVVQQARALSGKIAQDLGVRHASPQVIVLHRGRPVFDASHGRVTAQAVRQAVQTHASS